MRTLLSFFVITSAIVACGGAPQTAVHVAAPVASTVPKPVAEPPAVQPSSLALWIHVAKPAQLGALADSIAKPTNTPPSCAKGDRSACLELIDATRPVDFAVVAPGPNQDGEATAFSVRSVGDFLTRVKTSFDKSEQVRPGIVRLQPNVVCDVGNAASSLRVVCGTEKGIAALGPWLRTAPKLATHGIARAKVFAGPVIAAVDHALAGDSARDQALRLLAHDFAGASVELSAGDGPGSPLTLDLDVDVKKPESPWTRMLLAPAAAAGEVPETFGRLAHDATAVVYGPGGGPLVAWLDQLGAFASLASLDPTKLQGAAGDLRAVLARPMVCSHTIDFEQARGALDRARHATDKDREKKEAELDAAFESYFVCGVQEPIAAAEKLARKLAALEPKKPGEAVSFRSGASLGLPKGSFVVESTSAPTTPTTPAGKKRAKPVAPTKESMLVVPDGNTTWIVAGVGDGRLGARLVKRLLAQPTGALAGLDAPPGTVATGYLTSLFGAFNWDLAMRSFEKVETSLATVSPGRMRFVLSHPAGGSGNTIALRLTSDAATLKTLGANAAPLALLIALAFAQ